MAARSANWPAKWRTSRSLAGPKFRTDLYELNLAAGAIRRTTNLHPVVPEFSFTPSGTELIFTTGKLTHPYVGTYRRRRPPPGRRCRLTPPGAVRIAPVTTRRPSRSCGPGSA